MTKSEWAAAYVLRFGSKQIDIPMWVEGEEEFIAALCKDLRMNPAPISTLKSASWWLMIRFFIERHKNDPH